MPVIPFLLGVVTGSVITYVVKDDSSKQLLEETGDKITSGAGAVTKKVTNVFKKAKDSAEEATETAEDAVKTA